MTVNDVPTSKIQARLFVTTAAVLSTSKAFKRYKLNGENEM